MTPERKSFAPEKTGMNTAPERIREHVATNIRRPIPQVRPQMPHDKPAVLACGGPSLADSWDAIKAKLDDGACLVTVNNVHNEATSLYMAPGMHVQLDARPFNKRFIGEPQKQTLYCLASQVHPSVFDHVLDAGCERVALFHCDSGNGERDMLDEYYGGPEGKRWLVTEGGPTVALRAIGILRILGYQYLDIYGFDSCLVDGKHHAYEQRENDRAPEEIVMVGDREFHCHKWMVDQAHAFMHLMKYRARLWKGIRVHGDGLVAALMDGAVRKATEKDHVAA